jgi:hypothetical protein
MLDEVPLLVCQIGRRAQVGSLPDGRVRLNGTNQGIRAESIGYRL